MERGDADMFARLAAAPKWGNDDARVDRLAVAFHEARTGALADADRLAPGGPVLVCHVIRSLHHLSGTPLGATADGRAAHQALCDSIGAECGTAVEGPTAILNSVLKLDALRHYAGIYNLNLTFSGSQATPAVLRAMSEAFFEDGGQELQVNVLSREKLRAARANPESFPDLVVRIAG